MKVDNKNGIGNPYHKDSNGEFSSAEEANSNLSSEINSWQEQKVSFIQTQVDLLKGALNNATKENDAERIDSIQDMLDTYLRILDDENKKIYDMNTLTPDAFNNKYWGKYIGEKGEPKKIEEAIKTTNPRYSRLDKDFNQNCKCCVMAYELSRRGYNVIAKPTPKVFTDIEDIFANQKWTQKGELGENHKDVQNNIYKKMQDWGNGARAFIVMQYQSGLGHVLNIENNQGNIQICEAQAGKVFDFDYIYHYIANKTFANSIIISRVDNLEYIYEQDIKYLVEKGGINNE